MTDSTGRLYIVATPIGNLSDITHRAIETLKTVDLVLCEDTRRTRTLMQHYGLSARLLSVHEHNERSRAASVIERLKQGGQAAYVSDAGTPGISDPGARLVDSIVAAGIDVVPIPGPSSVTALLSVAGLPADRFVFDGFLPVKGGQRRKRIELLADDSRTLVVFESPFRITKTLTDLYDILGDRHACLGRELTKKFEEIRRETLSRLLDWSKSKPMKGEFVLAIAGRTKRAKSDSEEHSEIGDH
jgi:16S rRNA (cytidine1402-2'-O)-methyltransferase